MEEDESGDERRRMVENQLKTRGIHDNRVLRAMAEIPRHLFVPDNLRSAAYEDHPLPIGSGQTISQPFIVALMTELLDLSPGDRVLEIGSGSGYQAAILARIAGKVITIERIPGVAENARINLRRAGIPGVTVIEGDGTKGYPSAAPYDAILVTAGTPEVPQPLVDQLAEGGRLVAPVGTRDFQELVRLVRCGGKIERATFGGVVFVPLLGQYGWER